MEDRHVGRALRHDRHGELRIVGKPPGERDRVHLDIGMALLESLLHLDHALTVAAREEVPEGDTGPAGGLTEGGRATPGDSKTSYAEESKRAQKRPPVNGVIG